LNQILFLYI